MAISLPSPLSLPKIPSLPSLGKVPTPSTPSWKNPFVDPGVTNKSLAADAASMPPLEEPSNPNAFDADKYRVENLMYPIDLMGTDENGKSPYAGSYVVFYLNVNVDSKLASSEETVEIEPTDRGSSGLLVDKVRTDGIGRVTSDTIAGVQGATGGGAGGLVSGVGGVKGAAAGGAAGLVANEILGTQATTFTRAQKRLAAAIALHIPNQLTARYGVSWGDEDTGIYGMAQEGLEAVQAMFSDTDSGATPNDSASQKGKNVLTGIAGKLTPEASQGLMGVAQNPRKEQFFKGVDFRTFTFDYQFYPRSAEEAQNVLNIIKMFKLHMHPEFKDGNTFLYVYPTEFDISYYHNNIINDKIHKHTSCVLTEMSVQYSPNGQYSTFEDGTPTQINITMSFKELGLLTKEDIQNGL